MNDESNPLVPDSWYYHLRIRLAPLCLILVALLQIVLAKGCGLTPWKGGGFGMFSSIDARAARFVRIYLVTEGGDVPIALPKRLAKRGDELRAMPSRAKLEYLAGRLLRADWGDRDRKWIRVGARIKDLPDGQSLDHTSLNADGPLPDTAARLPGQMTSAADFGNYGAKGPSSDYIDVLAVRVELWRFEFDKSTTSITSEKVDEVQLDREDLEEDE